MVVIVGVALFLYKTLAVCTTIAVVVIVVVVMVVVVVAAAVVVLFLCQRFAPYKDCRSSGDSSSSSSSSSVFMSEVRTVQGL